MCNETAKNHVDEVTSKVNNSLMKKTKAQLVEIILRKDEVEHNLRADIKGTESELNKVRKEKTRIENRFAALETDYQNYCDESTYIRCELINKVKRCTIMLYILLAVSIGLLAYIIL